MKRTKENQKLPSGWRFKNGAYRFRVPPNARHHWDNKSEFTLGKTLAEAHATFAERIGYEGNVETMDQLCDRYTLEILPSKRPATQRSNQYSLLRIRKAFAGNHVAAIKPTHIYQYRDHIGRTESRKKANLDLEVLSHMFTTAIEWGLRDDHPMTNKKVRKFKLEHRTVLVAQDDVIAFTATLPLKWRLYVALSVWVSRRKGELLRLTKHDLLEEGMRFTNNKPPYNDLIVPWEPETRRIVEQLLRMPSSIGSMYLFHTNRGQPYIDQEGNTSGFDSIMQRHLAKFRRCGGAHFTLHDLRKVRPSQLSRHQAQSLLDHATGTTTGIYHLAPRVVDLGGKSGK